MLYPIIFEPILKEMIWGGNGIFPFKGLTLSYKNFGESWEISHVENNYSIVANGALKGFSIDELIKKYGVLLLGTNAMNLSGNRFPLLIKFIDAHDNLSIQVHPNDELAKIRHNSLGKTEMWYVINATPTAALYSGFSKQIDSDEYVKRIKNNSIVDVLKKYNVKAGDVFFLPAGRVHAIGAGCFIAEIQQTSDITYRIYDYNRKDKNGKQRELHTELAKDAIDYTLCSDYRTNYIPQKNKDTKLIDCKYFTTNLLDIDTDIAKDFSKLNSFVIYICMEGEVALEDNNGNGINIRQGQTVLIPANTENVTLHPKDKAKFLETYIN